jgi:hypothetical protein
MVLVQLAAMLAKQADEAAAVSPSAGRPARMANYPHVECIVTPMAKYIKLERIHGFLQR